ncbi:MAG: class I SAM-dependent methyltransferase [Clostridiales bacterium]|nr:class I SAM-dependent methyltransferase [Clostridiales bacterium]
MGLFKKLCNQTRKPEGFLGRLMAGSMNVGHARLADWGMSYLRGIEASAIVDLGCGGGRNARELMKLFPKAKLSALDYSKVSVEMTKKTNRQAIRADRCVVVQGNVAALPFEADSFDLATAFETVYFWPGLEKCFAEVYRVMKPGGFFLICNESDGTDEVTLRYSKIIDGMAYYTVQQLHDTLTAAGFSEIRADHHPEMPWITVLARK